MDRKTIYNATDRPSVPFYSVPVKVFKAISESKDLSYQLFKRDFFSVYKKSILGMGWVILSPLVATIQWVFLSQAGILNHGEMSPPYPLWVLIGSSVWMLFATIVETTSDSLSSNKHLILQIKFNHEVLVVKQLGQSLSVFLIGFTFNIVLLLCFGWVPTLTSVVFVIALIPLILIAMSLGTVLSVFCAVTGDIKSVLRVCLGIGMMTCPIVYDTASLDGLARDLVSMNPLTHIVCGPRDIFLYGTLDDIRMFMAFSVASVLVFLLSWKFYYSVERRVIERLV